MGGYNKTQVERKQEPGLSTEILGEDDSGSDHDDDTDSNWSYEAGDDYKLCVVDTFPDDYLNADVCPLAEKPRPFQVGRIEDPFFRGDCR